jgi:arylsulfatase A-like enzyme
VTPPNILIFMTDQEQAAVCAPDHPCRTPNADRLSASGVRFSEAYTPTAHCCPARATFFSGLYPSRHGVYNNVSNPQAIHRGLNPGVVTFGEGLRDAGYALTFCGKWHVSDLEGPADRGWQEVRVTAGKGNYSARGMEVWQARVDELQRQEREPRGRGQIKRPGWGDYRLYGTAPSKAGQPYGGNRDYQVIDAAIHALPGLADADTPWCLYVGPIGPHDPFIIPEPYASMYDPADIPLPPNYADTLADKPRVYQRMRGQYWGQLSPQEVRESIAHYWGYCTMMDDMLGDVLAALDRTGQADNTLVIFMSDHGEYGGAHGLYLKGVPAFREGYNIPAIMRWPAGIVNGGRVVDEFVTLADFAPTFLNLAGAPIPEGTHGRSLLPFLRDEKPHWRDALYTEMNGVELYYTQRSVTTKQYKYVYNGFDLDELYDLTIDPHEMVNRADDPALAGVKRSLVARMWQLATEHDDTVFTPYGTTALAPYGPGVAFDGGWDGN